MPDEFIPLIGIVTLFIGLPWLIFHYITKWKTAASISAPDEKLLDDLYDAARRLDERMCSIERILSAETPDWRQQCLPGTERSTPQALLEEFDQLEDRMQRLSTSRSKGRVE